MGHCLRALFILLTLTSSDINHPHNDDKYSSTLCIMEITYCNDIKLNTLYWSEYANEPHYTVRYSSLELLN